MNQYEKDRKLGSKMDPKSKGFSNRIARLNKLYHNLTPEQRANHPGFQRLFQVIQVEQDLNKKMTENFGGFRVQEPETEAPAKAEPAKPTDATATDKADQESQGGLDRPLNDIINKIGGVQ
jgi:hypothetical protein